mmetsp:Transcript_65564/g.106281  ORF Transcript_65564/g.106281 Transcript_65564/m.106281 type:complete len:84 (-) Transcript_65564:172-423(-)
MVIRCIVHRVSWLTLSEACLQKSLYSKGSVCVGRCIAERECVYEKMDSFKGVCVLAHGTWHTHSVSIATSQDGLPMERATERR